MAALISRFVNVPIARARPGRCPPRPRPGLHPSWLPSGWLKDCTQEAPRELSFTFFIFLYNSCPVCSKSLPHNLRSLLTFILFFPRCALCHCLFHSRPPPLSFPLTHVDYLSLFCCSLFLARCLPLSGKHLLFSAQPTLCPFTVSSSSSRTTPRLLLLISLPLCGPLSSPLIQARTAFI